ncbi:MAG: aminodeoxychorismate synthase component I [Sulfurimonas sp. RIFCSPHIGHO2_12_FULL_36_9]|nr:MAG: aminodeoxychorismate synthase component I [Sulfurimonas sp. RIFCSPHIGHO2_12_FULL_36_9]OHE00567.1 MAG: aminodeoxychorismate synthase component I [Sulfurimonas sp. RIFCSPLOWO2_02_FULL_36_28]OHE02222.1 MAG: aminodeoxychorismate synthase component I [Sulfurimonas sp. RIFCSPLOWO2_12_FULL_36_74]
MTFDDLNSLGKKREPFLFITDFKAQNIVVIPLDELHANNVEFCIDENYPIKTHLDFLEKQTLLFSEYKKKFDYVIEKIKAGDTYLLNLTQPTLVKTSLTLKEIFECANAHYKLRYKDEFVCFSPEKFIQIKESKISTYPMKGTIDASIANAKETILGNKKEMAEHVMVVDLLRNDLSIVAKNVKVEEFRYITEIEAGKKKLLHVSSHISGDLEDDWHSKIGDVLSALLPAGSISGAPKKSTLDIIEKVEGYERGFFSGVFGVYDGKALDSAVMIRFIEKTKNGYMYKSGGGITLDSDVKSEYNELLDKVYLP